MITKRFTVGIDAPTEALARKVITERVYFEEEYTDENGDEFDYTIWVEGEEEE